MFFWNKVSQNNMETIQSDLSSTFVEKVFLKLFLVVTQIHFVLIDVSPPFISVLTRLFEACVYFLDSFHEFIEEFRRNVIEVMEAEEELIEQVADDEEEDNREENAVQYDFHLDQR